MRYRIRHDTVYTYGSDVVHSHQLLHLVPRPTPYQQCLQHEVRITPVSHRRRDTVDAFGNIVTRVEFDQPHKRLEVTAEMEVDVHAPSKAVAAETQPWERTREMLAYHGHWPSRSDLDACRFRHESPYVRVKHVFNEFAAECFPSGKPILAGAETLMTKIHRELRYAPGETQVATPLMEILKHRRGVCQDFSHLMIACLRSLGLAARYVSGYVRLLTPRADSAPVTSNNIGASHAWVSVYAPPYGWIDLDPTNNARVTTDHIAIAWGRDFGDVSPLRGVILGGGSHEVTVGVEVREAVKPNGGIE